MKAIGFANKFYTLWEISTSRQPLGNHQYYQSTKHTYIKNISMDRETAFMKYPEAEFNESLRGKTNSWESCTTIWDNVDTYRFGKYQYQKIDNTDLNYLAWYWDNIYDNDHKAYIEKVLLENGYRVEHGECNSILLSPEDIENRRIEEARFNKMLNKISNAKVLYLTPDHNIDDEGYYRDGDLLYHFQEVKENYYAGTYYYLPVLKGKAKRIKNKILKITDFTYTINEYLHDIDIEILDFEIEK